GDGEDRHTAGQGLGLGRSPVHAERHRAAGGAGGGRDGNGRDPVAVEGRRRGVNGDGGRGCVDVEHAGSRAAQEVALGGIGRTQAVAAGVGAGQRERGRAARKLLRRQRGTVDGKLHGPGRGSGRRLHGNGDAAVAVVGHVGGGERSRGRGLADVQRGR